MSLLCFPAWWVQESRVTVLRAAEQRNLPSPAALLAAPSGSPALPLQGHRAAGMELEKAAKSHTVGHVFLLYLLFLWGAIMGPLFVPVVLCMSCCPS